MPMVEPMTAMRPPPPVRESSIMVRLLFLVARVFSHPPFGPIYYRESIIVFRSKEMSLLT